MHPPQFHDTDIVEQINVGDLPCIITHVQAGVVNRYSLKAIDGSMYHNIPEYMLVKARPPHESKWGS